jgi:hypothetical protein
MNYDEELFWAQLKTIVQDVVKQAFAERDEQRNKNIRMRNEILFAEMEGLNTFYEKKWKGEKK